MLLPQSSAFAALKNRLNSVNAIALLHVPPPMPTSARTSYVSSPISSSTVQFPTSLDSSHHARQQSVEKGTPLPVTLPYGSLTSSLNSVAAGSGIPGSSTNTVGRLAARRETGGLTANTNVAGEVKWIELLDKFKSTQERARRRNEKLLRGEDDDEWDNMPEIERRSTDGTARDHSAGPNAGGRTSRGSLGQNIDIGRPGSRLSLERGQPGPAASFAGRGGPGGFAITGQRQAAGYPGKFERSTQPEQAHEPAKPSGHKSKHSLIGKLGIRSTSKDKDKDRGGNPYGFPSGAGGTKR